MIWLVVSNMNFMFKQGFDGVFDLICAMVKRWIILYSWLVVWNIFFIFHNTWDNPSHCLIFFKMVIAPPTRYGEFTKRTWL